ncbi:putative metabotropic glutamate receptor mgl-1 like protein [Argiope bruennichi]|uniref:Putative metabotropic glutamate receptor mgl-1 like protein n=2 Tax=Argiope bruennichi TaxID=94029 RepID=A0A8T0E6A8_ARGBR|nr:putative metabotropic glutamate receptor mgl-1 like protein [Argiope bruennichi]
MNYELPERDQLLDQVTDIVGDLARFVTQVNGGKHISPSSSASVSYLHVVYQQDTTTYFYSNMTKIVLLITLFSIAFSQELRSDPAPIIYPGQVNIGIISNIHGPPDNGTDGCGPLRPEAVQRVMAAVWAAHQANFKKDDPQELNIGIYIYDTCGREDVAERQIYRLMGHVGHVQTTDCSEKRIPPLFAVITEGETDYLKVPLKLLNAFSVPVISTSGPGLPESHLLSTAPTTVALSRAAVSVLRQLRLLEVAVMAEDDNPTGLFGDFSRQAQVSGMQAIQLDHGTEHDDDDFLATLKLLSEYGKSRLKAVVFLVSSEEALNLLGMVNDESLPQIPWVIVTPSDISPVLKTFDKKQLGRFQKILLLSPQSTDIPEFDNYFQQLLDEDTIKYHPLLIEFLQSINGNGTDGNNTSSELPETTLTSMLSTSLNNSMEITKPESPTDQPIEPADVSSVVKAVWTLAASLKNVQKRSCRRGTDCLLYLRRSLSAYVSRAATTLNHVVDAGAENLKGMRLKFEEDGELASNRYGLRGFTEEGEIIDVGFYSDDEGLNVDHDVLMPFNEFIFVEPLSESSSSSSSSSAPYDSLSFSLKALADNFTTSTEPIIFNISDEILSTTIKPELVEWKIFDDVTAEDLTMGNRNGSVPAVLTSDLNKDLDLVLTLHDDSNLQLLSENSSVLNKEEERVGNRVDVGPKYSSEHHASSSSSSNLRSISLTSHQVPEANGAYRAEPSSRSDRRVDDSRAKPASSTSEDVKVVRASSSRHVSAWLGRPWALSVLGVCGFLILATLYILVFLMVKACEGSLKKTNCCLAGTQLVALLCLYLSAALYTWKPSALLCGLQRLMPNVSLAFCYGSLLLKGMYLRAQNSLGLGGSVNRCNQMLTLLFIVGVQVALETQWWLVHPPALATEVFECMTGKTEILQSQIYISFLLLMATALAVSTRRIPYNQPESRSLIATTLSCLVIFLSWDVACWLLPDSNSRNIAAPSALMATALTILLGIFGPQLFAIHKYGGFPHKPLSYADSLSTVFTMFKDLDNTSTSGTTARGKKNAKTLETPFATEMGEGTRNPLYSDYQSAYP